MVISRVNNFQNFPKKCQAVRRKIASELITLWEILSSTGLGCLTAPHLRSLANGLLMCKILAACPQTIPITLNSNDRYSIGVTDDINMAIKSTARAIKRQSF